MGEVRVVDGRRARFGVIHHADVDRDDFRALSPSTRCVYFTLLTFLGRDTGRAWVKVKKLAALNGVSERTAFRALSQLEAAQFLGRSKKHLSKSRRVNLYIVLDPDHPAWEDPDHEVWA